MVRNIYLSASIAALSFAFASASTERIEAIKSSLAHIEQAKADSMHELQTTAAIANQAVKHFEDKLGDSYQSDKAHVISLLETILQSPEFATTLNGAVSQFTDSVINKNMNFNDIFIDSTQFPLEAKIDSVLQQASPALNDQTSQIFNVFYVTLAIIKSSELFCQALDQHKNELLAELATLEAAAN